MKQDQIENPTKVQRILAERARLLARKPLQEIAGEMLDVVVVALETERYGLDVAHVSEIQPLSAVTTVPGLPSIWAGLVNVRSHLIPLLDLRAYLGLTPFSFQGNGNTSQVVMKKSSSAGKSNENQNAGGQIVLVKASGLQVGLLVDEVVEVQHLPRTAIGPSLKKAKSADRKVTEGLTSGLLTVLDLDALLSDPRLVVQDEVT